MAMEDPKNRVPKHNDTVTVEGRTGRFVVIGIDSLHETVEVRTTSAPITVVRDVPWSAISCL